MLKETMEFLKEHIWNIAFLLGCGSMCYGVFLLSKPSGFIFTGVLMCVIAYWVGGD